MEKVSPISVTEKNDIEKKCTLWYENNLEAAQRKKDIGEKLSIVDNVFLYADQWYSRIGITILYIVVLRWIQDLMNPGDDDGEIPLK